MKVILTNNEGEVDTAEVLETQNFQDDNKTRIIMDPKIDEDVDKENKFRFRDNFNCVMACLGSYIEQIVIFDPMKEDGFIKKNTINFEGEVDDNMNVKISNDCKLTFFSNSQESFTVETFKSFTKQRKLRQLRGK